MSTAASDPLAVIASTAPQFAAADAARAVRERWGLEGACTVLISERDQNFRFDCGGGRRYVLKIANAAEKPVVTDFQVQALLHIERCQANLAAPFRVPQIVPALDGRNLVTLHCGAARHAARLVSYLEGVLLADTAASTALDRELGAFLAHLGLALREFEHPGSAQDLLWDMQRALRLRELLEHIAERDLRGRVAQCLDDFERHAVAQLASLRAQVIHNDFHPGNVLVDAAAARIAGVIDFGDMLRAPLIVDVAVAAAYLRPVDDEPLARIAAFLAGYHAVRPLQPAELELLLLLIRTRLCTTLTILHWRTAARAAGDPYLRNAVEGEASAAEFLRQLMEISPGAARGIFDDACGGIS